jgi:hypothetical protein
MTTRDTRSKHGDAADGSSAMILGTRLSRRDGPAKVTGAADYAVEHSPDNLAHAVTVQSTIAAGRVRTIDVAAAQAYPGVLIVLTPDNALRLNSASSWLGEPPADGPYRPLAQDVTFSWQHIAAVVAETFEQATAAAGLVIDLTIGGFIEAGSIFRTRNETADISSSFNPRFRSPTRQLSPLGARVRRPRNPAQPVGSGQGNPDTALAGYVETDFPKRPDGCELDRDQHLQSADTAGLRHPRPTRSRAAPPGRAGLHPPHALQSRHDPSPGGHLADDRWAIRCGVHLDACFCPLMLPALPDVPHRYSNLS